VQASQADVCIVCAKKSAKSTERQGRPNGETMVVKKTSRERPEIAGIPKTTTTKSSFQKDSDVWEQIQGYKFPLAGPGDLQGEGKKPARVTRKKRLLQKTKLRNRGLIGKRGKSN